MLLREYGKLFALTQCQKRLTRGHSNDWCNCSNEVSENPGVTDVQKALIKVYVATLSLPGRYLFEYEMTQVLDVSSVPC